MERLAHIFVGALFAGDGLQKLSSAMDGRAVGVAAAVVWIAGALELAGGLSVAARSRAMMAAAPSAIETGDTRCGS